MQYTPTGNTSSRRSWKIRNISAEPRPIPRTIDKRVMSSSSASRPRRCSGTVPSTTFAARSRIEATFLPESPAARTFLAGTARTASAETSPSNSATHRPRIARPPPPVGGGTLGTWLSFRAPGGRSVRLRHKDNAQRSEPSHQHQSQKRGQGGQERGTRLFVERASRDNQKRHADQ